MLWATLAPTLKSAITSIALDAADPLWSAEWAEQAQPLVSPTVQAEILLRIPTSRAVYDETRRTYDANTQTITAVDHGLREFTLSIQARSYDLTYAAWAHEYCERIRTRIMRETPRATLLAAGVVLVERGPIVQVEATVDGRALSAANLDLFMRAGFEDAPQTGLGWIEKIELTTQVKNTDGVVLPTPPNVTDLLIPPGM